MTIVEVAKALHAIDVERHGLSAWEKLGHAPTEAYLEQARWVLQRFEAKPERDPVEELAVKLMYLSTRQPWEVPLHPLEKAKEMALVLLEGAEWIAELAKRLPSAGSRGENSNRGV